MVLEDKFDEELIFEEANENIVAEANKERAAADRWYKQRGGLGFNSNKNQNRVRVPGRTELPKSDRDKSSWIRDFYRMNPELEKITGNPAEVYKDIRIKYKIRSDDILPDYFPG